MTILSYSIFQAAQVVTQNIIMFLPRNMDKNQIEELSWLSSPPLELEVIFVGADSKLFYLNSKFDLLFYDD